MTAPEKERTKILWEDQIFDVRHIVRAEFKKTGERRGTLKIWFSADAGLRGEPLTFKDQDGDFLWSYLRTTAENAENQLII